MTIRQLLMEAEERFRRAGVPDPRYDARALLMSAFSIDSAYFLFYEGQELRTLIPRVCADEAALEQCLQQFTEYCTRREKREPLQQILGSVGFYGYTFRVTRDVLCPRQDTETLIDAAKEYEGINHKGRENHSAGGLLDLCTGSGCIGITLALECNFQKVVCTDLSEKALAIARENAGKLLPADKEICFLRSDLFEALSDEEKFDVIVSNPPYIRSEEIEELEPEVKTYEPRMALDGREDGLYFYRRIIENAPRFLVPGGSIVLEIGFDQGAAVRGLLENSRFSEIRIVKDAGGQDRVAAARKPMEEQ